MLKSTPRIRSLIEHTYSSSILYDVCCDHGLIGLNAALNHKFEQVEFIDISQSSLKKVELNLKKIESVVNEFKINLICASAVTHSFINEVDVCLIIAGIGSHLMIDILKNKSIENQKLILLPHSHHQVLESYLSGRGMAFEKQQVSERKRSYSLYLCH